MLSDIELKRADIVWLKLPQSLAPLSDAERQPFKIRPFIVLNESLNLKTNHSGFCTQDRSIFGMDCTSKDYLVAGRPHVSFTLPGHDDKPTYALLDSIRDISSYDQRVRVNHHLPDETRDQLMSELDTVLKPEQKFFLSALFNRKSQCMPGQIWRIKTINSDGEALVLLRRGRFVSNCNIEDSHDLDYSAQHLRHTPYLVAYFKKATGVKSLRGMKWDDIQIMAVQEQSFQYKTAELTPETSGILLNNIRARAGLAPVEYKQPVFKNAFNSMILARLMGMPAIG